MLSSSKPDGVFIFARSARITFTQFVTIASVSAISRTSSTTRVRLWFMARMIGPISVTLLPHSLLPLRGRRWPEGPDEGRHGIPSPGASRRPLPPGEGTVLLHFELHRRRHRADAPRRIDAGDGAGEHREHGGEQQHLAVEAERFTVVHELREHFDESSRQRHADDPAGN